MAAPDMNKNEPGVEHEISNGPVLAVVCVIGRAQKEKLVKPCPSAFIKGVANRDVPVQFLHLLLKVFFIQPAQMGVSFQVAVEFQEKRQVPFYILLSPGPPKRLWQ
jgi:hypothetical protein